MKRTQRLQKLIEYLLRMNDFVTVKKCSEYLNVSVRTVHYELENIKQLSSKYVLTKKSGVGIKLEIVSSLEYDFSNKDIDKKIAKMLVINCEIITIEKCAKQLYVSSSSIKNSLKKLEKILLKDTNAKIHSDNKGTKISATEFEFQKIMINYNEYFYDSNLPLEQYKNVIKEDYEENIVEECFNIILDFERFNLGSVAAHYIQNIFNVLIVMITRLKKGYHIFGINNVLKLDEILAMKHYLIALDLFQMLSNKLNFSFNENDISTLSIYLQANRLEFKKTKKSMNHTKINKIVNSMINKMSSSLNCDLSSDLNLKRNLYMHVYHMMYRIDNNITIKNPLINQIKSEFRLMFDMVWLIVGNEIEHMISEDEVGFLMLHFQTAIDKIENSKRILVVCTNGVVASNYIVTRIKKALRKFDKIELTSIDKVNNQLVDKVDFIISTEPINNINKPVVIVSPLVTELDIYNINKMYPLLGENIDLEDNYYFEYLDEKLIFVDKQFETKEEIINFLCKKMEKYGYVNKNYEQSVLNRESKGSTELITKAAVPHGSVDEVKQSVIAILTSKKSIKWDSEFVNVVIMIAISNKDLSKCKHLLSKVFGLVKTKQKTNLLLRKTKDEIIKLMLEGHNDI